MVTIGTESHSVAHALDTGDGPQAADFSQHLATGQSNNNGHLVVVGASYGTHSTGYQSGPTTMSTSAAAAADIPRLQTPPPGIMQYYTPATLQDGINVGPKDRLYRHTIVHGDQALLADYDKLRSLAVRAGKQNQKVLATVENHPLKTVFVHPYRMTEKPTGEPITIVEPPKHNEPIVCFGVDQALISANGERMPPWMAGTHELRHAAESQHTLSLREIKRGTFTDAMEERAMKGPEAEAMRVTGRKPRDQHSGITYRTTGLTETKAADPEVEKILQKMEPHLKLATRYVHHYIPDMAEAPTPIHVTTPEEIRDGATALGYRNMLMDVAKIEVKRQDGRLPPP
jgi:hypothetical protein